MAGKVCAFLHPNQTNRHFERASEAQIADLNNQAAINVQEITQQKDTSLAQIEALFLQGLQEIEASYQAEYEPTMAEFLKDKREILHFFEQIALEVK